VESPKEKYIDQLRVAQVFEGNRDINSRDSFVLRRTEKALLKMIDELTENLVGDGERKSRGTSSQRNPISLHRRSAQFIFDMVAVTMRLNSPAPHEPVSIAPAMSYDRGRQ
jgi:hypothetical protein